MSIERPWCCPETRCRPIHQLAGSDEPLSVPTPGESWLCFGKMDEPVVFTYDGVDHTNDLRSCWYTALKGVVANQENADDWRALRNAYVRALSALDGDIAETHGSGELRLSEVGQATYTEESDDVRPSWRPVGRRNRAGWGVS